MKLIINIEKNENDVLANVSGFIDHSNASEITNALQDLDFSIVNLTLDFNEVSYITSAGLRALLILRKNLPNERLKIINVNIEVENVFKMTGFAGMLNYSMKEEQVIDKNYVALLKDRCEKTPDKAAYVVGDKTYTWKDVDIASQIIANDLMRIGVKRGSNVGLCAPNSINWIFAFYAIQKLGAIAVLINFNLKPNEVVTVSEIGAANVLMYGAVPKYTEFESFTSMVKEENGIVKDVYDISYDVDFTSRFDEYENIKAKFGDMYNVDDPSIIIFTSGSAGKPKAVLSSAFNQLSSIIAVGKEFKISGEDRNCAFLPFFHVFGLATGISLQVLEGYTSYIPLSSKPDALLDLIEENKCTLFQTVPTMILGMMHSSNFSPERVESIRVSVLGGATTSETQMLTLKKAFPNNHFANIYGMSENAAISITKYDDSIKHITTTVGEPFSGIEVEIRDVETGKPVSQGEKGEICIRSNTMIVCYFMLDIDKQPIDMDGWLKTGDLGYIDEDGYINLVGRVKDLIIRGGENISPSEVAEAVAKLPEIADVKIIGVPNEILGEEVAAAVILKDGQEFWEGNREILKHNIANYKVPAYFVELDKFPLLGSGKIDALKLRELIIEKIKNKEYK